jgi:antitoxin component of MazEF toxin-antitoxin module
MEKKLTVVGNSKAVTLPGAWVKQHNVERITMQITDEGILIKPVKSMENASSLQLKMEKARAAKSHLYHQMEEQANCADTLSYYNDPNNTSDNVDLTIL